MTVVTNNKVLRSKKIQFQKNEYGFEEFKQRQTSIEKQSNTTLHNLCNRQQHKDTQKLSGSIENFIGYTQIPTGIAGPIQVNGTHANGDFYVPLATTEGALVASYHRGAKAAKLSGGITSICIKEGVKRCPLFGFNTLHNALAFTNWIESVEENFVLIAQAHTKHGQLNKTSFHIEGKSGHSYF